jgi:hypothetical protein
VTGRDPSAQPVAGDPVTLGPGPLAPPVAEAVRVAAKTYLEEPEADVAGRLRLELAQRGTVLEEASVLALARAVRAGRSEELIADTSDDTPS